MNASTVRGKSTAVQILVVTLAKITGLVKIPLRTNSGRIGLVIIAVYSITVIFGPWLTPYVPTEYDLDRRFESPSLSHLFGTDHNGRDVLSRVIAGARSIIWISVIGTAMGIFLGTIIGITSGYLGGWFDQIAMRAMDFLLSFPSLLLALLLITIGLQRTALDESWLIIAVIGIAFTPNNSRVIRSAALTIKPLEFVENARLRGEPLYHIVLKEILPNIIPVIGVEASLRLSFALLLTASLGFLGLGVQPPQPDWGLMVNESRSHLALAPWASLAPAFAMGTLVIGVNLFADGIRQSLQLPEDRGQK
ncbi:MAG: ABC transporter permease [Chloroflexota bacterium]|nr:ABC transporter permease [Chloroflexota bacterium]